MGSFAIIDTMLLPGVKRCTSALHSHRLHANASVLQPASCHH